MKTVTYPTAIEGIDNPVQVSRGKNHNLVLDRNGDVWGFGSNSNNPMGSGLGGKVKTASKLNGISNVRQIAAGTEFSLFLKNNGTVWSVGKNDKGQLGLGDTTNRTAPEKITSLSDVKKISVGEDCALALTNDGIYSWGANSHRQLGYGEANTIQNAPAKIEIDLSEGERIIDISAGMEFSIALTSSGKVYSWGYNTSGALGQSGIHYTPSLISTLSGIKKIEAGRRTGLAIDENDKLYSWGSGGDGQLGYSSSSVYTPREVTALSGKKINDITCGYSFSAVTDTDGNLYTFGNNQYSQLGTYSAQAVEISSPLISDIKWLSEYMKAYKEVTADIPLPSSAPSGSEITWTSGNTYYIANDGKIVSRPDCYGSDTDVKLYAEVTNNNRTFKPNYTATVKQDPTIKPSTDIPMRSIGMEYDQIYPSAAPDVYPEITAVSMSVIDETNGVYQLTIRDDQYKCANNAKPFFFWSARQGTFLPVEGYDKYRSVQFTIDPDALDKTVKVVAGLGDSLGYIDRKAILIDRNTADAAEASVSESNIMTLAEDGELAESDITVDETGASVSLAIGIDTSADMLNFDPGLTKTWMNSIDGLIDSASNSADMVLVTDDNFGYTKDAESAKASLELIKTKEYSGSTDALSLLERCDTALSDAENISQNGNKVAVLAVQKIEDINGLKSKIEELENKGTAVYIMLLSSEVYDDTEQIITCDSPLKLRINMSELYETFLSTAQVMAADGGTNISTSYLSDFRIGKHNFNLSIDGNAEQYSKTFGVYFAEILNMYGCLPVFTDGYNLFAKNLNDVHNIALNNATAVSQNSVIALTEYYKGMTGLLKGENINSVITKNLKYRFPVIAENSNGEVCLITESEGSDFKGYKNNNFTTLESITGVVNVLDTYSYLLETADKTAIVNYTDVSESFYENIYFTCPDEYNNESMIDETVKAVVYNKSGYATKSIEISTKQNNPYYVINNLTEDDIILCGVKTTYNNECYPNAFYTTRMYIVKKYADLKQAPADPWYYPYLLKATNKGMVGGDTDYYGNDTSVVADGSSIYYNADRNVTYGEFLKMLIESADIPQTEINNAVSNQINKVEDVISGHWSCDYICYAIEKGLITPANVSGTNSPDTEVLRCDAAYMINRLYIDDINKPDVRVPSNLYKYDTTISYDRNTLWNTGEAFKDQAEIKYCKEEIQQMYLNRVMDGDSNGYVNWSNELKRSEATKMLVKCQFMLDEGINKVEIVNEGQSNYIDLFDVTSFNITQLNDKNESGEFYFIAPKSGYYFIGVKNNSYTLERQINKDKTTYESITDDFTELYSGFGETIPNYITSKMNEDGYKYKRYYIDAGEYIKLNKTSTDEVNIRIKCPKDGDIVFRPRGDRRLIYASNPEYVAYSDLFDISENPTTLMSVDNLQPGKYTFMAWQNYTSINPAYIDVLFNASAGAKIKITGIGIQRPIIDADDGQDWTGTQAYANCKKLIWNDNANVFESTLESKWSAQEKYINVNYTENFLYGNNVFLSELYDNYLNLGSYPNINMLADSNTSAPIFIIFDFEVLDNPISIRQLAYKTRPWAETVLACNDSIYTYGEGTFKGITEKSSEVSCSINYNITSSTPEYLPVRTFNTQNPMGFDTKMWMTNVNPQEDYYGYEFFPDPEPNIYYSPVNIGAESDILPLYYSSNEKISLYGDSVDNTDNIWRFDVWHDWLKQPKEKILGDNGKPKINATTGKPEYNNIDKNSSYVPNNILKDVTVMNPNENMDMYCFDITGSTGNYSIKTSYDMRLTNSSNNKKMVEFHIGGIQNIIVEVENVRTGQSSVYYSDGIDNNKSSESDKCICQFEINSGESVEYKLSLTLVTGDPGTVTNCIKITNIND